eukprot:CAMPEP_0116882970 /NCGR_PEP_ID=MMETSP0463-20121206/15374_1 /TAXON_ID=181622 /ORGANISM="Strombidinopsis sp, Strain SopsisLIS2011" /LENGTH=72 /DNA_ID=CAMNT_0004537031 /DNA_START=321 /DNA_END=539 /DNA_ORIENTATION=+
MTQDLGEKNAELEDRLMTIGKLIHKNEQMNAQVRTYKLRYEKFKKDETAKFIKEIAEKNSEIEVLKEMVRSS